MKPRCGFETRERKSTAVLTAKLWNLASRRAKIPFRFFPAFGSARKTKLRGNYRRPDTFLQMVRFLPTGIMCVLIFITCTIEGSFPRTTRWIIAAVEITRTLEQVFISGNFRKRFSDVVATTRFYRTPGSSWYNKNIHPLNLKGRNRPLCRLRITRRQMPFETCPLLLPGLW